MSRVKSKGSKIEITLMRALSKSKLRFRKHVSKLPGTPDVAFMGKKTVVFMDSCFWHGCRRHCRFPKTNKKNWKEKILRNKKRDAIVNKEYKKMGWSIIRVWEHELKKNSEKVVAKIVLAATEKNANMTKNHEQKR